MFHTTVKISVGFVLLPFGEEVQNKLIVACTRCAIIKIEIIPKNHGFFMPCFRLYFLLLGSNRGLKKYRIEYFLFLYSVESSMYPHDVFHMREMSITSIGGVGNLSVGMTGEQIGKPMHH